MEKKREQDFANQEALRLSGVFNTPIPAQPSEREKALDKVDYAELGIIHLMTR